jgi:hypothetical protein
MAHVPSSRPRSSSAAATCNSAWGIYPERHLLAYLSGVIQRGRPPFSGCVMPPAGTADRPAMGPESSSHKVTITPNRWLIEALVAGGRQIANQAQGRGVFESDRLNEPSMTFSQEVFGRMCLIPGLRLHGAAHQRGGCFQAA